MHNKTNKYDYLSKLIIVPMKYKNQRLNCCCGCLLCSIPRLYVYLHIGMSPLKQSYGIAFELGYLRVSPLLRLHCAPSGCTRHASCVDSKPKKKNPLCPVIGLGLPNQRKKDIINRS